jgi:hypothetical protein
MAKREVRGQRPWGPELETALLRALGSEMALVNWRHFQGRLRPAALRLTDVAVLGRWISGERTIEMSRPLVLERPWGEVVEVLRHELAHQYVEEVLGVLDEPPHGPTFQRVCAERAIDPRAAGRPEDVEGDSETGRLVEKIRRLLALAGSPNQHEAELAMRRAQELMLKHQLSLQGAERRYVFRQLGTPSRRKSRAEGYIGGLLGEHFFVEVIWSRVYEPLERAAKSVLEVCGTPENVDMAEYVHAYLMRTAEHLWKEARKGRPDLRPGDRSAFMSGVISGFSEKLAGARREQRGQGLVWVGDPGLSTFFQRRHPRTRTVSSSRSKRWAAQAAGRAEGRKVVLHRPLEGGSSGGGPRLLGEG